VGVSVCHKWSVGCKHRMSCCCFLNGLLFVCLFVSFIFDLRLLCCWKLYGWKGKVDAKMRKSEKNERIMVEMMMFCMMRHFAELCDFVDDCIADEEKNLFLSVTL